MPCAILDNMRWLASLLLCFMCVVPSYGWLEPLPYDKGSAGLLQQLRKLQTRARILYIVAHPDDEDGATIAHLSRGLGAEVVLLSLTRGESGANIVTDDAFDRLGLLRSVELRRGAQYYGARLRFTRAVDYGYSKTIEECWSQWNEDEVIADVVRVIREERPHVIISRWQGTARDGHGNHTASGIVSPKAYAAAADPERYPEQLAAGSRTWKALKHYANNRSQLDPWTVKSETGIFDPMLGQSYAQIGREGLRQQRSQSIGTVIMGPGSLATYYLRTDPPAADDEREGGFLEGIDLSMSAYPALQAHIDEAMRRFDGQHPERSAPALAAALAEVRRMRRSGDDRDLSVKEAQIEKALLLSLGLEVEALVRPASAPTGQMAMFVPAVTFAVATPGQRFPVAVTLHQRLEQGIQLLGIELQTPAGWQVEDEGDGRFQVTVPADARPTSAFWKRDSVKETFYRYASDAEFGQPLPDAPVHALVMFEFQGVRIYARQPVLVSQVDEKGLQYRKALSVGPSLSLRTETEAGILPLSKDAYALNVELRNVGSAAIAGTVRLELPQGWRSEPQTQTFAMEKEGEAVGAAFRIVPPAELRGGRVTVAAVAAANGKEYRHTFQPVTQPGYEVVYYERPATHEIALVDAKIAPNLKVGYIMGAGDLVAAGIEQLGASVEMLDTSSLASADLSRYHTIVMGIRAYAVRKDVLTYNQRLLDYVKQGGVLVVQYNTPEYDNNFGPYPYQMGRRAEEVSEEDSPVKLLAPDAPVFQMPNRITLADFDGWVEQRGSKHLVSWAPEYTPLVEMHDRGQDPQRGIWLEARHGKGMYIYCSLAWYRQLPFAVPGAARIFANLISLGAPGAPWRPQ
ncbi:MAG: PIG-L family deacetylase [Bryobacterales bacterium]|nr:PIG-L family deacetylase [Bryobacterales bacterium]